MSDKDNKDYRTTNEVETRFLKALDIFVVGCVVNSDLEMITALSIMAAWMGDMARVNYSEETVRWLGEAIIDRINQPVPQMTMIDGAPMVKQ